jgi:hypothetical protein
MPAGREPNRWFPGRNLAKLSGVATVAFFLTWGGSTAWAQPAEGRPRASVPAEAGGWTPIASASGLFAPAEPSGLVRDVDHRPTSHRSLLSEIAADFGRFVRSRESYTIVGLGLVSALGTHPLDHRITTSTFNHELNEGGFVDGLFEPGKVLGSAAVQLGGALATFGVGKMSRSDDLSSLGRDLVRAQLLTQGITQLIKYSVRRERPDGSARSSFPSGHASGAFATATVLHRHYGWKVGAPAYGLASYIAASRLSENRHFLSDVVLGMAVGVAAGRTVAFHRGSNRFELTPVIVAGGAVAQVSIVKRHVR